MSMFNGQRVCIAICTPLPKKEVPGFGQVYDTISPRWHRARSGLMLPTNINISEVFADGMEVGDARSKVAASISKQDQPPSFLFFIDYDVLLPPDALTKLFFRARCYPEHDIFAGVYCCKWHNPPDPLIYTEHGQGAFWDWTVGDLLTTEQHGIKSVHMGLTLIRTSLFKRLIEAKLVHGDGDDQEDEPFFKTEYIHKDCRLQAGTEDIYFCDRVSKLNPPGKILVDTSVLAGHEDKNTGVVYGLPYNDGPAKRALWGPGEKGKRKEETTEETKCDKCDGLGYVNEDEMDRCRYCKGKGITKTVFKIALDIGAGGERRKWEGHKTYTTDIRSDTKPDYVQDTRMLNLPEDHFDLVGSSHHLEHLGRWDQEMVWKEIFKVCKPGGVIEHIVPSLDWAAQKILTGKVDEHVMNVLYGAQEAHGYTEQPRLYNLHYFGYTKDIAKSLAEMVGFVAVTCEDWRDALSNGYNLIIRGRKPFPTSVIINGFDEGILNGSLKEPESVSEGLRTDSQELRPIAECH